MTTIDFIPAFFCQVDEQMGNRAFYRWLTRDYRPLFPQLPERTRLFRLFKTHQDWTQVFLAAPTVRAERRGPTMRGQDLPDPLPQRRVILGGL